MPYVKIELIGKLTKDQKQKIVEQVSRTLEDVAGKPKDHTYVVIDEVERENWGAGGKLMG